MQFDSIHTSILLSFISISRAFLAPIESNPPLHCLNELLLLSNHLECSPAGTGELVSSVNTHLKPISIETSYPFFPWSYEPVCTPELESIGSKLCVYTNASFSNGRGVSIFTTPQIAKKFALLPPFQEPGALAGINGPHGPWYTQQLKGKGMGMLASRKLKRKDLVTAYTPVLLVYREQEISMQERERFLRTALNQLPPATRKSYLELSIIYGDPNFVVQDVLKANTFEIQVGGEMHLALVPETSRINHACGPNSQYYFDADLFTHFVHAVRTIAEGEEITISYTDLLAPTAERQEHLHESFHFTCSCPRCTSKTSDTVLSRIASLRAHLSNWDADSTATTKKAEKLIQIFREEGLDAFLDIAYGHAVLTYSAIGDKGMAVKYAKLAQEAVRMTNGPHAPDFRLWEEVMGNPEGHWSWRFRKP